MKNWDPIEWLIFLIPTTCLVLIVIGAVQGKDASFDACGCHAVVSAHGASVETDGGLR